MVLFGAVQLQVPLAAEVEMPVLTLCAALPAILYARLIIPALFAAGRPAPVTGSSLLRVLLLTPVLCLLHWAGASVLSAAALAFAAVEIGGGLWIGAMSAKGNGPADTALPIHASKA